MEIGKNRQECQERRVNQGYYEFIDLLKGFGIFLVVWGHTMTPRSVYIYSFHMPLFFFLSGFVHKNKPWAHFFWGKVNGLYVPYVVFTIFSWVFYFLRHLWYERYAVLNAHLVKLSSLVTGNANNGGNNPIWFLTCIFGVSLIFWLISNGIKNSKLVWTVVIGLSLVGYGLSIFKMRLWFNTHIALTGIVFYAVGYTVKMRGWLAYLNQINWWTLVAIIGAGEGLHLAAAYGNIHLSGIRWVNMAGNVMGNYFLFYLSAFGGILAFLAIGYRIGSLNILNLLGVNSLVILGMHKPLLLLLNSFWVTHWDIQTSWYGLGASLMALIILTPLGSVIGGKAPQLIGKKPLFGRLNRSIQNDGSEGAAVQTEKDCHDSS